jgi:hypothetical protein
MNKEDLIIKYLDNQLTTEDQKNFEKQLSESADLQKEFQKYADVNSKISDLKRIESNQHYFNSVLLRFRQKQQNRSTVFERKNFGYAFSIVVMFIISFMVFNLTYTSNEPERLIKFTESLTEDEKIELLSTLNDEIPKEYLNKVYTDYYQTNIETELTEVEDKNQIADAFNLEIYDIEEIVTEEEFENIYSELISMNFFSEEKL